MEGIPEGPAVLVVGGRGWGADDSGTREEPKCLLPGRAVCNALGGGDPPRGLLGNFEFKFGLLSFLTSKLFNFLRALS